MIGVAVRVFSRDVHVARVGGGNQVEVPVAHDENVPRRDISIFVHTATHGEYRYQAITGPWPCPRYMSGPAPHGEYRSLVPRMTGPYHFRLGTPPAVPS